MAGRKRGESVYHLSLFPRFRLSQIGAYTHCVASSTAPIRFKKLLISPFTLGVMSIPSDITSLLGDPPCDPSNDVQPDYSLPEHEDARRKEMEREDCEEAQAVNFLGYLWRRERTKRMSAWERYQEWLDAGRQVEEEEVRRLDEDLRPQDQEEGARDYDAPSSGVAAGPASKIAFPGINRGALPDTATLPVAEWARAALAKGELAPLWYCCGDGRHDARERLHKASSLIDKETKMEASLDHVTGQFTWSATPLGAKRSPNEVPDSALTRAQFSESKYTFLRLIADLGWPEEHVQLWASLFSAIEDSRIPLNHKNGWAAMMEYLSRVRREYHTAILDKRGGNISDFSLVNESAVKEILERIDATERDASFTAQSAAIARMMSNASEIGRAHV